MSFVRYLLSHAFGVACGLLIEAFLLFMLPVLGVERDPTLLTILVCGMLMVVALVWGYLRERRLMNALTQLAKEDDAVVERAGELEEPGYPEGDLAVDAVSNVARVARAQIDDANQDTRDYRRYVETWVHEIKTPIAAMSLFLENHGDPSLQPLRRDLTRVEGYVEQALFYARSSSVEKDYLIRVYPLDELVRAAVRSRAGALIEAGMAVSLAGLSPGEVEEAPGENVPPTVYCDAKWMEFILGQFIDNAVRYRADPQVDGRMPRIEFLSRVEAAGTARERVLLGVRDNGCGISDADLPRVFERGFTGENGRSHERSTGMGLYLVRTLCQKMGLGVSIASKFGSWTCVTIIFPRL